MRTAGEHVDTRVALERTRVQHPQVLNQAQQGDYQLMTERQSGSMQDQAEQLVLELRKRILQHKRELLSEGAPTIETDRKRRAIETQQQQQLDWNLLSGSLNLRAALRCKREIVNCKTVNHQLENRPKTQSLHIQEVVDDNCSKE